MQMRHVVPGWPSVLFVIFVICAICFYFILFHRTSGVRRRGAAFIFLFYFPCSADHERDWQPPCEVAFFGLATNTLNVRNNINN